jgi:pyruvate dehydrogenase complex dehydrogenase (E1) component
MHSFGASGKIADVYENFGINVDAVVRAAHETLANLTASRMEAHSPPEHYNKETEWRKSSE